MRRNFGLHVHTAYPGVLGVTTEKGQQDVKPLVLDAPTESYELMFLRWQTGVFEVGASAPLFVPDPDYPSAALALLDQFISLSMDEMVAAELARQITENNYSANRLSLAGMPLVLATYLAESLKASTYSFASAIALSLNPDVASLLSTIFGVVVLPPLPVLTPIVGTVNNSDSVGKIVINLPNLVEGETRIYTPINGPQFGIGSDGDLIRGAVNFASGSYSGQITQSNGQDTAVVTTVTVNATDLPVVMLSQPPFQTADSTPLVVGSLIWNTHSVAGLTVTIKVNGVTNGTAVTDGQGAFTYEITPALLTGQTYTILASVEAVGNPSAQTPVSVS